jgi:AraC family transcriptional regulator, ethanolamine operon transcriptional activator
LDLGAVMPMPITQLLSHDAEEHGRGLHGWMLDYMQMASGPFRGTLIQFWLDHIQLYREKTDRLLMKRGASWPDSVVLSLPVSADGYGWSGGHQLPIGHGLLSDGHSLPEILTPQTLDVICIAFDRRWFVARAVDRGYPEVADQVWRQTGLSMPPERLAGLRVFFLDMVDEVTRRPDLLTSPAARTAIEGAVLDILLEALSNSDAVDLRLQTPQKKITDLARAYALAHAFDKPGIEDLCRQAGVSRRHLQNCFLQSYGMSAIQLLKALRLNAVRRELKRNATEKKFVSIGDAAANWGFWHWSRFSAEYHKLFGELPSQTGHPQPTPKVSGAS